MAVCLLLVLPVLHNLWCVGLICVGLCGVHAVSLTCVRLWAHCQGGGVAQHGGARLMNVLVHACSLK